MARSFFGSNWYRVADLRPRLRPHVELHRQRFRGQTWYMVQDHQSGRFHRLSPGAQYIVCLMDGQRPMRRIWELAEARFGAEVPPQDEVIRLLAQLHTADLVVTQGLPDLGELDERAQRIERRNLLTRIRNPLAIRLPLWDPDDFITATMPLVWPLFTWVGALAWLLLVVVGGAHAWLHWDALTANLADQVLSADNLIVLALVYPLVKAIHELGHAYATKRWGGEVHELGVMFLVLMPVPYVDASASVAFREWWRRAIVGGAGILVELALAAIAIILWVHSEPGLFRAALFNVALIGSVSTVFFNGNPLLRYDGYYVFCDLLRIPNLGTRSNRYLGYLVQRYAFGLREVESPVVERGERGWFVAYGVLSFVYRIAIMIAIAIFIGSAFFFVGVLLAAWAIIVSLGWPIFQGLKFVAASHRLREIRGRAIALTAGTVAAVLAAVTLIPLPYATVAQGVVWVPSGGVVRAETPGTVAELIGTPGGPVRAGEPLLRIEDPELHTLLRVTESKLDEVIVRRDAALQSDRAEAKALDEEIARAERYLERYRRQERDLIVRAPRDGALILPTPADLVGQFVDRGRELGYVVEPDDRTVRVVISESEVDLVRASPREVSVRLAARAREVVPGRLVREIPAAGDRLPSKALAAAGGGPFSTDPGDAESLRALAPIFQFEVEVDAALLEAGLGARVYVRFDHGSASLAHRVYREARQLFLSQFDV